MAAKRFYSETDSNPDQQGERRKRARPTLASIIGEVVMVNSLQHLCSALEPVLRRVVNEEVDRCLRFHSRSFTRSSSLRIQALEPSSLQIIFCTNLLRPIFTGTKIVDVNSNPLQLLIVDMSGAHPIPATLSHSIKVELVVLDGDFPDGENWSTEDFNGKIVKERTGKRPLLHGDLNFTMREGSATIGDIEFTDNSSWIRSRKFRLGARVVPGSNYQGARIREAMTEPFTVKDHRGELYKKHHPPSLEDDVWRLEKIGKEGAFHKKLSKEGIHTVQDFLKLSIVDPQKLKKILGIGMSDKMWEVTLKHAKTCKMGSKLYIFRGSDLMLIFNPICQVVEAHINGQIYPAQDLNSTLNREAHIRNLVRQAYMNWHSLEEVDGAVNETSLLLTQGEAVEQHDPNQNKEMLTLSTTINPQSEYACDSSVEVGYELSEGQVGCNNMSDWFLASTSNIGGATVLQGSIYQPHISASSSDGDSPSSRIFIHRIDG